MNETQDQSNDKSLTLKLENKLRIENLTVSKNKKKNQN